MYYKILKKTTIFYEGDYNWDKSFGPEPNYYWILTKKDPHREMKMTGLYTVINKGTEFMIEDMDASGILLKQPKPKLFVWLSHSQSKKLLK